MVGGGVAAAGLAGVGIGYSIRQIPGADAWVQGRLDAILGDPSDAYAREHSLAYLPAGVDPDYVTNAGPTSASNQSQGAPVMPAGLSEADQSLWRTCNELYSTYASTKGEVGAQNALLNPMKDAIANGRASPAETAAYCSQLDEQIARVQRLCDERSQYIDAGCDKFDWFNRGSTEAARLARHQSQLAQDRAQLQNLTDFRNRYCR